jgi:hypothetical protein
MACRVMSALSGDYGAERRSDCIAFRDSNFKLLSSAVLYLLRSLEFLRIFFARSVAI